MNPVSWVLGAAFLALVFFGVRWYVMEREREVAWEGLEQALEQEPGYAVLVAERDGSVVTLRGLRDPLARPLEELAEGTWREELELQATWAAFDDPADALTLERARRLLEPPGGVQLEVREGVLTLRGSADAPWVSRARVAAPLVPGVRSVDLAALAERDG